jgi:dTDP-4-dehydrorhamnose reductase
MILDLAGSRDVIRVVSDQTGCPTETRELSAALLALIDKDKKGIYHACGSGVCSRYEFAGEIVRLSGLSVAVHPIKSRDYPLPAKRPKNSSLDCSKLRRATRFKFKPWQETLADFFERNINTGERGATA